MDIQINESDHTRIYIMPKATTSKATRMLKSKKPYNNSTPKTIINNLRTLYKENANNLNAAQMKQYLRNQFEFYGIKSPQRRALDKEVLDTASPLTQKDIIQLLDLSWNEKCREMQLFGIDYATKYRDQLAGDSVETCLESMECVKKLITTKSWWDTVDMLAINVVGHLVKCYRDELGPIMDTWIMHENMWLRRTAILHQLKFKDETDKKILFRYCKECCHEKEFFIEKAIGWALREYHKSDKDAVRTFVKNNASTLSTLSRREALKHD